MLQDVLVSPRWTVAVFDGTKRHGLAGAARDTLDAAIYTVLEVGSTASPVTQSTIYTDEKNRRIAEAIAGELGISAVIETRTPPPATIVVRKPSSPPVQFTVTLGNDYHVTAHSSATMTNENVPLADILANCYT